MSSPVCALHVLPMPLLTYYDYALKVDNFIKQQTVTLRLKQF